MLITVGVKRRTLKTSPNLLLVTCKECYPDNECQHHNVTSLLIRMLFLTNEPLPSLAVILEH